MNINETYPFAGSFVLIGVDPGPTTGIIGMRWAPDVRYRPNVLHCDPDSVLLVLRAMTGRLYRPHTDTLALIAVEDFVDGNRHDHSAAARATRDVIRSIEDNIPEMLTRVVAFPANKHKPWEDRGKRLKAAGLWHLTDGWRHARSAASVALYAGVKGGHRVDPLSAAAKPLDWFT